ncbi:MAG: hypothetical protein LBM97_00610 [Candidatus Nomurabacteria bacterium]|jgi:hypothetical protein|nr:hypothetical protein [Candidatus Nomurabacteria bacterium]
MKLQNKKAGKSLLAMFLAVALMMSAFSITAFARSDKPQTDWQGAIVKVDSAYNVLSITPEKGGGGSGGNPAWGAGAGANLTAALKNLQAQNLVDSKGEGVTVVPLAIQSSLLSFIKNVTVSYTEDKYNGVGNIQLTSDTVTGVVGYTVGKPTVQADGVAAGSVVAITPDTGTQIKSGSPILGNADISIPWMDTVWGKAIGAPIRGTVKILGGEIYYNPTDGSITAYLPTETQAEDALAFYGLSTTAVFSKTDSTAKFIVADYGANAAIVAVDGKSYKNLDEFTFGTSEDIVFVYGDVTRTTNTGTGSNPVYAPYKGILTYNAAYPVSPGVTAPVWIYTPFETGGPYDVNVTDDTNNGVFYGVR